MNTCPSCASRVRPGQEECEHCGFPLTAAQPSAGRETRIDGDAPPAKPLYRPGSGRKTRIEPADPFAASATPAPSAKAEALAAIDPADPFRQAVVGADAPARRRRTIIGGGKASPDDPFAAALTAPGSGWPALERPLAGWFVTFSGAPNGRLIPLTLGRTLIGRDPGPAGPDVLALDDDSVSNVHCVVVAREAGVMMKDEMSSNGTLHRAAGATEYRDIMAETVRLEDGDLIKLGETVLQLRLLDRASIAAIWGSA